MTETVAVAGADASSAMTSATIMTRFPKVADGVQVIDARGLDRYGLGECLVFQRLHPNPQSN